MNRNIYQQTSPKWSSKSALYCYNSVEKLERRSRSILEACRCEHSLNCQLFHINCRNANFGNSFTVDEVCNTKFRVQGTKSNDT